MKAVTIKFDEPGKPISPDLFGIFFEDINWAADGGLCAELIQNRSFEFASTDRTEWNAMTAWEKRGRMDVLISTSVPVHVNNRHYAALQTDEPGAVLVNTG